MPVVNIVGDHATYHKQYDAQLESDIETVARNVSPWVRWSHTPGRHRPGRRRGRRRRLGPAGPGGDADPAGRRELVGRRAGRRADPAPPTVPGRRRQRRRRRQGPALGRAVRVPAGRAGAAGRRAGRRQPGRERHRRGDAGRDVPHPARAGRRPPAVDRLAYLAEFASAQLAGLRHLVLVDAKSPVSFFAYPGKASDLVPDGCEVHVLANGGGNAAAAARGPGRGRRRPRRRRHPPARRASPTCPPAS